MEEPEFFSQQQNDAPLIPAFVAPKSKWALFKEWFQNHPRKRAITLGAAVVLILLVVIFRGGVGGMPFLVPNASYTPVYTLVNDKISQHGAIVVNLPKGVAKGGAETKVSFDPVIQGEWVASALPESLVYKPVAPLSLGKHYLVSLAIDQSSIKKDFLVDEDPAVVSVFPDATAEAEPASAITIVFNRPMVPLTTLSELDSKSVPVTITPATPGKYKWISTRTLQFIPSGTLFGSAHYTVVIRPDFVSMDGLSIPGKTYSFITKQLRLDHRTERTIVYNQPINFSFNQPVDLQKTLADITVTNASTNEHIAFVASYGTKSVWDSNSSTYKDVQDTSIVSILPKNSLYGHSNVWDFETSYTATIGTAYSVGGDITLTGPAAEASVTTTAVLQDVTAQSDKTDLASPDLFDPSGTATFSFYEDIDIGKTAVHAKGLKKIEYGQKCQSTDSYQSSDTCIKVDDKSLLIMSFDAGAYARGERVSVTFDKLVNSLGYQLNNGPLVEQLAVYPVLQILKTVPLSGDNKASISELYLCTNVPLAADDAKAFYQNFHADKYLVFGRFDGAYRQNDDPYEKNPPCRVGDYVSHIHYGLLPQSSYSLSFSVEDVFAQKADAQLTLHTGPAPEFYLRFQSLQKIYSVTTPDKTKLTYETENFDYVNVTVCKVSPDTMVRYLTAQPPDISTVPNSDFSCVLSVTKKIALKSDQWVNQFFQIDLKDYVPDPRGQYVISFSHPQYQDEKGNQLYARTYLSVTNLAVTDNRVKWASYDLLPDVPNLTPSDTRGSLFWLSRIHTLEPEGGAKVSVYQTTNPGRSDAPLVLARTGTTNTSGFAEFPLIADVVGAAITSGDDTVVVSAWTDTLSEGSWSGAQQDEKVYMYTDRPIYRPGQEVFLKGLYRVNFDGMFSVYRDKNVDIEITDSGGNTILTQKVPVSAYGTFGANVTLPSDASLGTYLIRARNQYTYFDVQEYVGSAFETTAKSDKDEYVAGEVANIAVSGKYYFGVPLDGGTLDYSITSQNYYFDRYTDEYFNFGSDWYNCYDCGYGDTYLKSGKATLDASGAASVALPLDFATLYKAADGDQSKIIVFHGTVKDKQGKSVSVESSFIVHRGDFYVGVKSDPSFTAAKQPFTLRVKSVDDAGKPVSKSNITVTINKVDWPSNKRQEVDGGYYNRPTRTLTPILTKQVATNATGDYSDQTVLQDPGDYEIDAVGKDGRGNEVKSTSEMYIYGQGEVTVQPTNNATLNISAEQTDLQVGEVAKLIIQNPYPHAKALVTIERGRIFTYEVVDLTQNIYEYQFPITQDYVPNVYASVVLLSPGPEVKFAQLQFTVDRKKKELTIDTRTDKSSYLPGEKVNLTITTTDSSGAPVPADVSVAVADVSVLALAGNPKKDPLVFFYDGFPLTVTAETNVKNLLEETPIPTGTKGGSGGGGADLSTRKRGEFRDTAFWQAEVITDVKGVAHVSFTLPDNLTKWQIESLGITKDTKLGVKYQEIVAQKQVMTIPIVPRFIVPGDEFMIGAKIFNQTQSTQSLAVSLVSPTLSLQDSGATQKTIKAGDTATVYFKVKAPLEKVEGTHTFTLSAKNADFNDTVDQSLPITRNMTYESTATAGSTSASSSQEYLYLPDTVLTDRGGVTIKTSATLAVYLSDALTYLFAYPYGCSEQLASKLSAIAITKRALAVPNVGSSFTLPKVTFNGVDYTVDQAVDIGLNQIYDNQTTDGGFSYYKGLKSDAFLTMQVLTTLADLKSAGYDVRSWAIDQAVHYLRGQIVSFKSLPDTDALILAGYALSLSDAGSPAQNALMADIVNAATTQYLSDRASSDTLGYLAILAVKSNAPQAFKDKVFATLGNRVDIDSRGAYMKPNPNNFGWSYYETPEKDTALFIKALVADKREYAQTPNLIRWLVASRSKDGSWGSTNTSVAAIDALSDYLTWKRETESSFTLTTTLDSATVSTTSFNAANILSTIQTFLPVAQITPNKTHTLAFNKTNNNSLPNNFYYDLSLKYYLPVAQIAPRDEGVAITRDFYSLTDPKNLHPLTSTKVGDVIRGVLTIISPKERHLFSVEDYIPAGFELVNFSLATEDQTLQTDAGGYTGAALETTHAKAPSLAENNAFSLADLLAAPSHEFLAALGFYSDSSAAGATTDTPITYQKFHPDFQELHDDRLFLFAEDVAPGTYTYEYYLRATTPGTFSHLPAVASDLYFPENFGRTSGSLFTVEQ